MVQRVTYRRRLSYNTKSNKISVTKTPGGRIVAHRLRKRGSPVSCGDCGIALAGIPHARPAVLKRMPKREKNVTRAYGGSRCAECVRARIVRSFLVDEQRIVKKVLKDQAKQQAAKN